MRYRFCPSCGKKIVDGSICECRKESRKNYYKNYKRDKTLDSYRWKKKREFILKRDGRICQRCLIKYGIINYDDMQVHHIKSRKNYPELTFEDSNLISICGTCNRQLGTKDELDFEWELRDSEYNL